MQIVIALVACAAVLALPWAACSYWAWRRVVDIEERLEAVAIGFAAVGITAWVTWLVGTTLGLRLSWILAANGLISLALLLDARRGQDRRTASAERSARVPIVIGLLLVGMVLASFLPFGLERGDGVHTPAMTDWYKHLIVTSAIDGSAAFPPPNPFLRSDTSPEYYFGFHLVGAVVSRVTGGLGDAYPSLLALTLVVAAALPLVFYTLARPLGRGVAVVASAATLITGFDVVVIALDAMRHAWAAWPVQLDFQGLRDIVPSTHVDYWIHHNERQFNGLYLLTSWAPQHVAGLLLALIVVLLVRPRKGNPSLRRGGWLLPAITLASLPCVSAYVAAGLACGVAAYVLIDSRDTWPRPWQGPAARRWGPVGFAALVLAAPVLPALATGQGSSSQLGFAISAAGSWSNGALFNTVFGDHWWSRLLDTPAVYLFEFGLVGILALLFALRSRGRDESGRLDESIVVAIAILVLVAVIRPPFGGPNNIYARGSLVAYGLMVPLAARELVRRGRRRWIGFGAAIGAAGTAYALVGMTLQGLAFWPVHPNLVDACNHLLQTTPRTESLAIHPDDFNRYFGFFCRRPLVLADQRHARLLGAPQAEFSSGTADVLEAYASPSMNVAAVRFQELDADVILVQASEIPEWALSPCFDVEHRNPSWALIRRVDGACD